MAGAKKDEKEKLAPIVVKRVKKVAGGHHGGAWKVAYADFVTAMMAFFLLLWLLNVTTEDQKNAISNYFDPSHPKVSEVTSGAGGVLAGMSMAPAGAMVSSVQPISQPDVPDTSTRGEAMGDTQGSQPDPEHTREDIAAKIEEEMRRQEDQRFQKAADQLMSEIQKSADLKDLAKNLLIDITPEGLRIQIVDDQGRSMFPSGSAQMFDFMRQLLIKVTGAVTPLPNQISVRGHTDSNKYKDPSNYDNWNLSADRAQASRRVMVGAGMPEGRIENVMGRADREHLIPTDPQNARNRRISIILLRDKTVSAQAAKKADQIMKDRAKAASADAAALRAARETAGSLRVVDDTKPAPQGSGTAQGSPAQGAAPQGTGAAPGATKAGATKAGAMAGANEDNAPMAPLPVLRSNGLHAQPQVLEFGHGEESEQVGTDQQGTLYKGPAQTPYENKPPTITTPLFHLPSQEKDAPSHPAPVPHAVPAPAQEGAAKGAAQESPHATSALDFGDSHGFTPSKPLAPAVLPPAGGAAPKQVLEFGDGPAAPPVSVPADAAPAPDGTGTRSLSFP